MSQSVAQQLGDELRYIEVLIIDVDHCLVTRDVRNRNMGSKVSTLCYRAGARYTCVEARRSSRFLKIECLHPFVNFILADDISEKKMAGLTAYETMCKSPDFETVWFLLGGHDGHPWVRMVWDVHRV
jgi:hypothetical protein